MPKEEDLLAEIGRLRIQLEKANKRIKTAKYGIVWMDIPEAFEENGETRMPVLSEIKENTIKNDDGQPTHLLIEGDSYCLYK